MRIVLLVLALAACGEVRQTHRWPDHRREKDAQIAAIAEQARALEQKAAALELRMKQLEGELAKLRQPAAPQPAPAGVPSPSS